MGYASGMPPWNPRENAALLYHGGNFGAAATFGAVAAFASEIAPCSVSLLRGGCSCASAILRACSIPLMGLFSRADFLVGGVGMVSMAQTLKVGKV